MSNDSGQYVTKGCTETNGIKDKAFLTFNPFSANVTLMKKPRSYFLLAKCMKNNSGRVTF